MHKSTKINTATFEFPAGIIVAGITEKFGIPNFFRSAKEKFTIDIKCNLEHMRLEAFHNGKLIAFNEIKGAPQYDDYCELFILAVKLIAKRKSNIIGYTFILE